MKAKKKTAGKTATEKPAKRTLASRPGKKGDGKTTGLLTGKGVSEFWNAILAANALSKKKLVDSQLAALVKKEFPGRKIVQPVGRVRSFFNRGVQGYGNPPGKNVRETKKESFAYTPAGDVTKSVDWGFDRKTSKKLSAVAKKRALKAWAKRKRKTAKKPAGKMKIKKAAKKAA